MSPHIHPIAPFSFLYFHSFLLKKLLLHLTRMLMACCRNHPLRVYHPPPRIPARFRRRQAIKMMHRPADRLCRSRTADHGRDLPVRHHLPFRNLLHYLVDPIIKIHTCKNIPNSFQDRKNVIYTHPALFRSKFHFPKLLL